MANSQRFTKRSKLAITGNNLPLASRANAVDVLAVEAKVTLVNRGIEAVSQSDPTAISLGKAPNRRTDIQASAAVLSADAAVTVRLDSQVRSDLTRSIISSNRDNTGGGGSSSDYNHQLAAQRYGFLPSGAEIATMRQMGTRPWMMGQLSNSGLDFGNNVVPYDTRLRLFCAFRSASGGLTGERLQILYNNYKIDGVQYYRQMALTNRPILHRLAQFFFNHLAGKFPMGDAEQYGMGIQATSYFAHTILPNMFGKFEDMLKAASRFPAMMMQYSVVTSVSGPYPVQDWPREVMELHTVGADSGYVQADIEALARLWTGHKVWMNSNETADANGRVGGRAWFNAAQHDAGAKSFPFLGIEMAAYPNDRASGPQRLDQVLTALARHQATANRIADKLLFHFVGDDRNWSGFQNAKTRISQVYMQTQGDIMAVARALLQDMNSLHPIPYKSPRPHDLLMGMVRAGGLVTQAAASGEDAFLENMMTNYLPVLGRPHLQVPDVRGYLVDNSRWVNDASIMQILDHVSMIAPLIAARIPAINFYNNTISSLASSSLMTSTSQQITQFAAAEPINAIICTLMSPEVLMRRY